MTDLSPQSFVDRLLGVPDPVLSILQFVVVFLLLYILGVRVLIPFGVRKLTDREFDETIVTPIKNVSTILVIVFSFGIAFAMSGFGSLLSAVGFIIAALTVAVGLAARDFIANVIAGLYIINERLFQVGDWIEWDGYKGRVNDISLRITKVRTFDNELLTVPNADLTNTVVRNPVAFDRLRISWQFPVGYADVGRATDVLVETGLEHPEILDDPPPTVRVVETTEEYAGLNARLWIDAPGRSDFNRIRTEYVASVSQALAEEDIRADPVRIEYSGTINQNDSYDIDQ
jgi:small-conductance mechanosensitive channel